MLTVAAARRRRRSTTAVETQLHADKPQRVIASAAQLLSSLSQFAGVITPPRQPSVFQQIEFMRLSDKRILLIIVDARRRRAEPHHVHRSATTRRRSCVEAAQLTSTRITPACRFEEVRERLHERDRPAARRHAALMHGRGEAGSEAMAERDDTS